MNLTTAKLDDARIAAITELAPPAHVMRHSFVTDAAKATVQNARSAIHNILHGRDDRLIVVIGPCSIHDPKAALEYCAKLLPLRRELASELEIVMRVYFEKPRTTVGWKGLINDPDLDGSFNINKGLLTARELLLNINDQGMPAGTEFLDVISPQYIADLVSWGAIGARTTESQVHRELASGLSCAVGFKNGTDGNITIAADAIKAANHSHHFLSVTKGGVSAIVSTNGNEDCHIILRGGKTPNYDADNVQSACSALKNNGLRQQVMIDCSHANSSKQHKNQITVAQNIAEQIAGGESRICGVMIESHLLEGRQNLTDASQLVYGQSITDACIGWEDSERVLRELAGAVSQHRKQRKIKAQ